MEMQLARWHRELSAEDYVSVMEDLCSQVATAAHNDIAPWLAVGKMFMERARGTIPHLKKVTTSSAYGSSWKTIEAFEKESNANQRRLKSNRQVVDDRRRSPTL
jgi:hypothetical protein